MIKYRPACFGCASTTSTTAVPTKTTSFYATNLGDVSLTWRRSFFGLSLLVDSCLFPLPRAENQRNLAVERILYCISLFHPFNWKGSKRLRLTSAGGRGRAVEIFWDLSGATFSSGWGPKPAAGFFVAVAVNREVVLVEGDLREEAFHRMKSMRPGNGEFVIEPISTRVDLKLKEIGREISWMEIVRIGGREREVSMSIDLKKMRLRLAVDGVRILQLRRLWWKFRGSERVAAECGDRIRVSWDLHRLLFSTKSGDEESPAPTKAGDAVFVLQFENGEEGLYCKMRRGWANLGKTGDWSESSSCSSSTTPSSLSVEDWESPEEAELRNSDTGGFTLVVCGRKS